MTHKFNYPSEEVGKQLHEALLEPEKYKKKVFTVPVYRGLRKTITNMVKSITTQKS
jgi:hypothetical protein